MSNLNYLQLKEYISKLEKCSNQYIEAVLLAKLNTKYSLNEISEAIQMYRDEQCKPTKRLNKTKTIRNIILRASQQTSIVLNMELFNSRKNNVDFLKACAIKLNAEIVYK